MFRLQVTALRLLLVVLIVCVVSNSYAEDNGNIRFIGSKYLSYYVTDMAKYFVDNRPNTNVTVAYADHYSLISELAQKTADAIMVLGKLDDDMKQEASEQGVQLQEQLIGWGGVTIIVNPENPINEISIEQVRKIFVGQFKNWKEVGGLDEPIFPMTRDESVSGTEKFFRDFVLNGEPTGQQTLRLFDHDIARAVWKRKGAIADARYTEAIRARIRGRVKVLAIKQDEDSPAIMPSVESLRSQAYPVAAPMYLYYDGKSQIGTLGDFARFCARRGLGVQFAEARK
jgi:phosphate transport system substrate-binding protein